jgi:hypothetical protein
MTHLQCTINTFNKNSVQSKKYKICQHIPLYNEHRHELYNYRQETNLRYWVNEAEFVACIILTEKNNYEDRVMSVMTGPLLLPA